MVHDPYRMLNKLLAGANMSPVGPASREEPDMTEQNYATDGEEISMTEVEMKLRHDAFDNEGQKIPIIVECGPGENADEGSFGGFPFSVFDNFKSETLVAYLKKRWRFGETIAMRIVNEIHRQALNAKNRE